VHETENQNAGDLTKQNLFLSQIKDMDGIVALAQEFRGMVQHSIKNPRYFCLAAIPSL
jgi:hypothetical protein